MKEQTSASLPLQGLTIVVTGSRRAPEQSALVTNLGGMPYVVPTVGISIPRDDSEIEPFLKELVGPEGADYAVFMTATGVRAMMLAAERSWDEGRGLEGVELRPDGRRREERQAQGGAGEDRHQGGRLAAQGGGDGELVSSSSSGRGAWPGSASRYCGTARGATRLGGGSLPRAAAACSSA